MTDHSQKTHKDPPPYETPTREHHKGGQQGAFYLEIRDNLPSNSKILMNLIEVDDGGRWNIVDNTYKGNTWSRFINDTQRITSLYSPDDALTVWNIYLEII